MATRAKKVPHSIDYKAVETVDTISNYVLICSAIISIAILITDNDIYFNENKDNRLIFLNSVLSIIAVSYFVLDMINNYLFQKAEEHRRNDFIDNSLGTTLASENSSGYFSNEAVSKGIFKMGANSFENSFFTLEISNRMKLKMVIKSAIIILLFLATAFFTTHKILAGVFQITLPFTVLQQTVRLFIFNARVKNIFENFKTIFSSVAYKRNQLLISLVLKYETTLSWGSIFLSSKIFEKHNERLSSEYNKLKLRYEIS